MFLREPDFSGGGGVGVSDLADACGEIEEAGNGGEEASEDGDGDEVGDVEHEPEDGYELGKGGDFAGPVGLDVAFADEMIDEEGTADAGDVAKNDQDGEPEGEMLAPAGEAEGDNG